MGVGEEQIGLFAELTLDFGNHFHGSFTHRLHGHGREPERQVGTDQEEGEGEWMEDLHLADEPARGEANAYDEGAVES